jgi:predicted MPP superfamily phosphohydrolase
MRNKGGYVRVGSFDLFIAGIDDPRTSTANLTSALQNRYVDAVTVLLSHSAEVYRAAESAGVDLLLAGHTHGGQVRLPWYGAPYTNDRLGRRFAAGMIEKGRLQIHVGRGVGWAKFRVRLFCPPEVTLISLQP